MKKYLLLIVMLFVGGLPVFAYTQQELLARLTAALREHASSQDSEELLFQRMFAGLDWEVPRSDELQNPVLKKQVSSPVLKPQTQMVEYSSAYESIRDDTSYSSYRSVVEDIVSQYRSPEIGEVRPSTFSTSVDGSHITLHDDLLELYVEIVDDDERHVPADR
ncbi:MAG: hypothetical protein H6765_08040 [Candidatus Peribacteria bacterium]|nr:MAG: hypothetical protein H6765_08040 [Candidatus Peribacteria bacterium]